MAHKTTNARTADFGPTLTHPVAPDEDRCDFQSTGAFVGGFAFTRCLEDRNHEGDHVVSAGGCEPGLMYVPAGTKSATELPFGFSY